jgi:hypothetical protein
METSRRHTGDGKPQAQEIDVGTMSSMQYTIGTALERAREAGSTVEVLVDQHWLTGQVVANDGVGVVLDHEGEEHCVVRLERIAAVRVSARAPMLRRIPGARTADDGAAESPYDGARPMPGPQAATA